MRPDPDTAGPAGSGGLWRVVGSATATAALVVTSAAVFYVATRDDGLETKSLSGTTQVAAIPGFSEVGGADLLGFSNQPARRQSHEGMVMIGRTADTVFVVCGRRASSSRTTTPPHGCTTERRRHPSP